MNLPYQVNNFMRSWLELQFPTGMPLTAWRANISQHHDPHFDARSVYIDVKQRLAVKEQVLHKALSLNRLSQWMNHDGALIDKINAVTVLLLVPQGLFWLALYADRSVSWAEPVGRACGLAACLGGAACTLCATAGQSRIIFLKWDLRRRLGQHRKTSSLALLKDRCEALNLYRCACWTCTIAVATWWLLFKAHVVLILVLSSVSCIVLSMFGIVMWRSLSKSNAPFPSLFKFWFVHVWALTPFFCALALAHLVSGWRKSVSVLSAAVVPVMVLCGDAAMLIRGKVSCSPACTSEDACQIVALMSVLSLALLGLLIACGRVVGAAWAVAVPLTALSSPLQLPLLACVLTALFGACSACHAAAKRTSRRARKCLAGCFFKLCPRWRRVEVPPASQNFDA